MLSYRHGFHAGNHADVLKHMVLCLIMRRLAAKDKPFTVIDTHSGAGIYDLSSAFANKNQEFNSGFSLIKDNARLQELVPEYYEVIAKSNEEALKNTGSKGANSGGRSSNSGGKVVNSSGKGANSGGNSGSNSLDKSLRDSNIRFYPGSPYFEYALAREQDSIFVHDTHPAEYESLLNIFKRKRHVRVELRPFADSINALLPPLKRRGLIFIDPPYEEAHEYREVVSVLKKGLQRFPQGIYAIWYPVLARLKDQSKSLVQQIKRLNVPLLQSELCVTAQEEKVGMCGSGMLIVNFPYQLDEDLYPIMEELYKSLADPQQGSAKLTVITEPA